MNEEKSIQQLEEELKERKWKKRALEWKEEQAKLDFFRANEGIDVYTSDDYCGLRAGPYVFYYGYEVTEGDDEDAEWCFQATVGNKIVMTIPRSKLWPSDREEPFFHLLTGIGMFLRDKTP